MLFDFLFIVALILLDMVFTLINIGFKKDISIIVILLMINMGIVFYLFILVFIIQADAAKELNRLEYILLKKLEEMKRDNE